MQSYLGEKKPNDKVKLTVFRFDKLRDVNFTLGSDLRKDYGLSPLDDPSAQQKRLYKAYLNADLQ
jgi:predicted metalloprotease with PDZ domain